MPAPIAVYAAKKIGLRRVLQLAAVAVVLAVGMLFALVAAPVMFVVAFTGSISEQEAPSTGGGGLVQSEQGWWRPTTGAITSWYGPRRIICGGTGCSTGFHSGIDFGAACGTPIVAIYAGTVTFVGNAGAFGNRVIVDHGGGIESIYGHIKPNTFAVAVGDHIEGGQQVAQVGATGVVSGCHLDLKIRISGSHVDPAPFLRERGITI